MYIYIKLLYFSLLIYSFDIVYFFQFHLADQHNVAQSLVRNVAYLTHII